MGGYKQLQHDCNCREWVAISSYNMTATAYSLDGSNSYMNISTLDALKIISNAKVKVAAQPRIIISGYNINFVSLLVRL